MNNDIETKKEGVLTEKEFIEPAEPRFLANAESNAVNKSAPVSNNVEEKPVLLRGDNQKEEICLLPGDLLYIASADNYVSLCYTEGGKQKSALLRGSLKKFEEQLANHQGFFRCHRMYIVNLWAVTDVSGNAQGLKLHLAGTDEAIPVSRNLTETVKEKLHGLSRSPQNA